MLGDPHLLYELSVVRVYNVIYIATVCISNVSTLSMNPTEKAVLVRDKALRKR